MKISSMQLSLMVTAESCHIKEQPEKKLQPKRWKFTENPAVSPSRQQILHRPEWVRAPGSFLSLLLESSWDELAVLLQMKARAYSQ